MSYRNTTDLRTAGIAPSTYQFDDPVQRIVQISILGFFILLGIFGNSLVIFAVSVSRKLQTKTNAFVVSLAFSDLASCLSTPLHFVVFPGRDLSLKDSVLCKVAGALSSILFANSIVNLALIAFSRYYLITRPKPSYDKLFSTRNVSAMILSTWAYVIVVSQLPSWIGLAKFGFSTKFQACTKDTDHPLVVYNDVIWGLLIYLPLFVVTTLCYYSIYVFLWKHRIFENIRKGNQCDIPASDIAKARSRKISVKITKSMLITVVVSMGCIMPSAIAAPIPGTEGVIQWLAMLVVVHSCINPLIYGFNHPHFKVIFGAILKRKFKDIPEPSSLGKRIISIQIESKL